VGKVKLNKSAIPNRKQAEPVIPEAFIKINQVGIVLTVLLAFVLHHFWPLIILWFIQLVSYKYGIHLNVFVRAVAPFIRRMDFEKGQSPELARFNSRLALGMIFAASLCGVVEWWPGVYIFGGMLVAAATAAILGYCIGCTMYFQYKQFKARRLAK
jgi:hypothetical protein